MIEYYKKYILNEAERVSDRGGYRRLMVYLKKVGRFPGGKESAAAIAQTLRTEYRCRSAMMDELRKIGY